MAAPFTGAAASEVGSQAIALPTGGGSVQGLGESFSAQPSTGVAGVSIPFQLLPARGGVDPALVLSYSSGQGSGLAGMGWSLSAAFIARQTDRGAPKYDDRAAWHPEQDRFIGPGGAELVPICTVGSGGACDGTLQGEVMPAWAAGWQYFRPRVEGGFLRFFWSPDHQSWRVQSKSGASMEFGVPLDGTRDDNAVEADPSNPARVFRWNLAREYDAVGDPSPAASAAPTPVNVIIYRYARNGGESYLTDIYDTPPRAAASTAGHSTFAHHTRLAYEAREDVLTSFRRGWQTTRALRLARVDVATKSFGAAATSARQMVRRYHLAYAGDRHTSFLWSVQLEGRCSSAVDEDAAQSLPLGTSCPRLAPTTLDYSRVAGPPQIPGFEPFASSIQAMASSPPWTAGRMAADLLDVNGDALPDLLATSITAAPGGHAAYLNQGGRFAQTPVAVPLSPLGTATHSDLNLDSSSIALLDLNGVGATQMLHLPASNTEYFVYELAQRSGTPAWEGRRVVPAGASALFTLARGNPNARVADVNGDGLVDVIVSTSAEVQTFFSLGRFAGGADQFGTAEWTSATTARLSTDPAKACVPVDAGAVELRDPNVRLADMNGDGLVDIVRVLSGSLRYWPGRGDGFWGTGSRTECSTTSPAGSIVVSDAPVFSSAGGLVRLSDMNGDGLDDVVLVLGTGVRVWLNVDGSRFTSQSHLIAQNTSNADTVRFVDVNGSGTLDVLWTQGGTYKYVDLAGGSRPGLLTRIGNGLGKTTQVEYATSTALMTAAAASASPWTSTTPFPVHVVRRVTERDNLDKVGGPAGSYVTEYEYRDPVYDARQREFRGFRQTRVVKPGDGATAASAIDATVLLGECPASNEACSLGNRWRDNPREALKGMAVLSDTHDLSGIYHSTTHNTIRLRRLYTGLDGRGVYYAFGSATDTFLYDTSHAAASAESRTLPELEEEDASTDVTVAATRDVVVRAPEGSAHLRSETTADVFGHPRSVVARGCIEGCGAVDESITSYTETVLIPGGSGWNWATSEQYIVGSRQPGMRRRHTHFAHTPAGLVRAVTAELSGTLPLDRHHASGAPVAPAPPAAARDGNVELSAFEYDDLGNQTRVRGPDGRCRSTTYDENYGDIPVTDTVHAGPRDPSIGCGTTALTTTGGYDRAFGITAALGPSGELASLAYDGFGRTVEMRRASAVSTGLVSAAPSVKFEYLQPADPESQPFSRLHVMVLDAATEAQAVYRHAWTYVDAMGRPIAKLDEADAADGASWIVSGRVAFDARGNVLRSYLAAPFAGDASAFPLAAPSGPHREQRHDAFGRMVESVDVDGTRTSHVAYRARSLDLADAADIAASAGSATPTTVTFDGHGRTVATVERVLTGGRIDERETSAIHEPTGEISIITRRHVGTSDPPVVRWVRRDSLGRVVLNVEPNTSLGFTPDPGADATGIKAWRYAYDDAGKVIGTSDSRGCGSNVYYDTVGRRVAEDYSPCLSHHAAYSPVDLTTGAGAESFTRYDVADPDAPAEVSGGSYLGRASSHADRGQKTVVAYDPRGRVTKLARRVAAPTGGYAPRWYVESVGLDEADRELSRTTGAAVPELLGDDGTSAIAVAYSTRGLVQRVASSYGTLIARTEHDLLGRTTLVEHGDAAKTTTRVQYDARLRPFNVRTDRALSPQWSSPPASYQPPPTSSSGTLQLVLEDVTFAYDLNGNPTAIADGRAADEWPTGAKPTSRTMAYDDAGRVLRVDYARGGDDPWTSPYAGDDRATPEVRFDQRVKWHSYRYDWLGNIAESQDDSAGFYDRSFGVAVHGAAGAGPYQLRSSAGDAANARGGALATAFDASGSLASMTISRSGPCLPAGATCSVRFVYDWDEVGRLVRARRWDLAYPGTPTSPVPYDIPAADLRYAYDASGVRVLKTATDEQGNQVHDVYVFDSLELRQARWTAADYERTAKTESVYLVAGGRRLGRVIYDDTLPRTSSASNRHVLLEVPDHLGSASAAIDHATGELVQKTSYQPYGAREADYRPARWGNQREPYGFTGKEDDIEVGLIYFGARYLLAALGTWASADPVTIHALGADLNAYAYVHGRVMQATDPFGLQEGGTQIPPTPGPGTDNTGGPSPGASGWAEFWWKVGNFFNKVGEGFAGFFEGIGSAIGKLFEKTFLSPRVPEPTAQPPVDRTGTRYAWKAWSHNFVLGFPAGAQSFLTRGPPGTNDQYALSGAQQAWEENWGNEFMAPGTDPASGALVRGADRASNVLMLYAGGKGSSGVLLSDAKGATVAAAAETRAVTRLPILEPTFVPDATRIMRQEVAKANDYLSQDLSRVGDYLTQGQMTEGMAAVPAPKMWYGKALEMRAAEQIKGNPLHNEILKHVGDRPNMPDFVGRGCVAELCFDVTTTGQVQTKFPGGMPKYGSGMQVIPYDMPSGVPWRF